jgi:mRNA interferase MazF
MSRQATHLLEEFEALPEEDKRVFTAEILRRAAPFESGELDDSETPVAAPAAIAPFRLHSSPANWTIVRPLTPPTNSLFCLTPKRMNPVRGEVWLFDLGMAGKVRPVLIVSVAYGDFDRALVTILPNTTSLRGSQYEVVVEVSFLKPGAFMVQNVATYPNVSHSKAGSAQEAPV